MASSGPLLRPRPRGGRVTAAPPGAAARAAALSMTSVLLALVAYHVAFGSMPPWDVRAVAAAGLFCAAVPLGAGRTPRGVPRSARPVRGDRPPGPPAAAARRAAVTRLARALRTACGPPGTRRGTPRGLRRGTLGRVERQVRRACRVLARLLRPAPGPLAPRAPRPVPRFSSAPRDASALPLLLLLADAVVRRGPPARPSPAA
ncbi:hypothetical protein [Streptomyces sp. NPDC052114]|uniref:hypothetical protein n=1 Tax=unclassified Streptomyces TaxID=2593676 RepID=UPI00341579AC